MTIERRHFRIGQTRRSGRSGTYISRELMVETLLFVTRASSREHPSPEQAQAPDVDEKRTTRCSSRWYEDSDTV